MTDLLVGSFLVSVPLTIFNVYYAYHCKTFKQPNIWESVRPLVPLFVLFTVTSGWAYFSPADVINQDPRTFYFMVGTVFSNIAVSLESSNATSNIY